MARRAIGCMFALFLGNNHYSQVKEIDTITIKDPLLENTLASQKIIALQSSALQKNALQLSETLRFQTPLFIKENGRGSVSSPTVRGTTAQQTTFLWNGINVNSLFLGQGDMSSIGVPNFNNIYVKVGAGSLRLGSGAMAASVHFNNHLTYNSPLNGHLYSEFSSFNTILNAAKLNFSNDKFSVQLNTSFSQSENDYEVPEKKYLNRNGNFHHFHYGVSAGYRFLPHHEVNMHSLFSIGNQHFPIFDSTTIPTKYLTNGVKSQLNYQYNGKNFQNKLTTAWIDEAFEYYANIHKKKPSSGGNGHSIILRNSATYLFPKNGMKILAMGEFQHNEAKGLNSGIQHPKRHWTSFFAEISKKISRKTIVELSVRKNFIENIQSPWLFSLSSKVNINRFWSFNLNASNNFRLPTFNDLYWIPGGNPSLNPESAWQVESMQTLKLGTMQIDIVPYYSHFKDKIQWLPTSEGFWTPTNVSETKAYGAEIYFSYKKTIQKNNWEVKGSYAYTRSIDVSTQLQNQYIPFHKASAMISFSSKKWNSYLQGLYNGMVFTTNDEDREQALDPYFIANVGAAFEIFNQWKLGGKINNIFNQPYYTTAYYPLPLRNYAVHISYQF